MNKGKNPSPLLRDFFKKHKESLKLHIVQRAGFSRPLASSSRPLEIFPIRVWGNKFFQEFEALPDNERRSFAAEHMNNELVAVIAADGGDFFPEMLEEARKRNVTLFRSDLPWGKCREEVKMLIASLFSGEKLVSGGLLKISGLGVMIIGDSGIGKSESTLELISRGYQFVSDDVTCVQMRGEDRLYGTAPEIIRDLMEVRGLGIINIRAIFGPQAISPHAEIDLVIKLNRWEEGKEYDRLGLKPLEKHEILGLSIPQVSIPVALGRNIATLIEVACRVHLQRARGSHTPKELIRRLNRALVRKPKA